MRRSVLGLDRAAAILTGLLLVIAGAVIAGWYDGGLVRLWPSVSRELSTGGAGDVLDTAWWPWAAGAAGTLAVVLGLWWLAAHLPRRGAGLLVLPGSGASGRLLLDPAGTAGAAAEALADTPGFRSAHGRILHDRGELVVALTGTVDPRADLTTIVAAADSVAATLRAVLGRDDARARVRLSVARRARAQARVL
ncbi:hypothetical protein [Actinoplanes rectilineatus]|uniref:hypothetical protein n=1 Tax=Actinoplanes rectilineatus TaxID=113571 RepID=UPI0005F2A263|nr:hypothetical protein [Actinoplanes rectilineatus]